MSDLAIALGKRLRCCRRGAGMTQEEVAERAGLHPTYIGQVERGEKNVTVESLGKILRALDSSLAELFSSFGDIYEPKDSIPRECYNLIVQRSEQEQKAIHDIIYKVVDLADGHVER